MYNKRSASVLTPSSVKLLVYAGKNARYLWL